MLPEIISYFASTEIFAEFHMPSYAATLFFAIANFVLEQVIPLRAISEHLIASAKVITYKMEKC
jgi:hypothetical protein